MAKKRDSYKPAKHKGSLSKDLWISPHLNLRGRNGDRAWDGSGNILPGTGPSFRELADIALGNKKPASSKKRSAGTTAHQTTKKEPYYLQALQGTNGLAGNTGNMPSAPEIDHLNSDDALPPPLEAEDDGPLQGR